MATSVRIPPPPTEAPNVHLKPPGRTKPRTLRGDLGRLKSKVSSAKTRWSTDRKAADDRMTKVREEAATVLAPLKGKVSEEKKLAGEVMKPVYKAIETVKTNLDPANGKTRPYVTSFMISSALCWVIGPQALVALYDRIVLMSGRTLASPTHDTSVLAAGHGTGWGILHGPGRWFRDTVGMAYETGQASKLVWAGIIGLMPMIILGIRNMSVNYIAQGAYRGKLATLGIKWLTRAAYLVPVVYMVGLGYPDYVAALFGSPWTVEWWQVWVMGLVCSAYYCTMWVFDRVEKGLGLGYIHVLLMTPLASLITGAVLYAPGAAW